MAKIRIKKSISLDLEVLQYNDLSFAEWVLLEQINFLSKGKGYCYARRETIAEALKITVRGLQKMLKRLIEKELVARVGRDGLKVTSKWFKLQEIGDNKHEQSSPLNTNKVHHKHEQSSPLNTNKVHPLTIKGEIEESKEDIKLPDILNEWVEYRKEIKKPIADTTIKKLLEDYNKNPIAFTEKVNFSISNGYQGLFAPKQTGLSVVDKNKATYEQIKSEYVGGIFDGV